jgi:sarcosine oxidase subunit beta
VLLAPVRYLPAAPSTAELVIVGGGIVGAATAFHAARAGLRPVLIDRRPRLCTLTTPAAAGAFRLQFDNREELELVRESVELFLNFEEITGQREYRSGVRQQGYLWLTTTEDGAARQRELVVRQHGWGQADIELLEGGEVRRRFPFVGSNVRQARFRAGDGFVDQKQITMGFAAASGAGILTGCEVTGFDIRGGRLHGVQTTRGTIGTGTAVIAAGPFSGIVAGFAGISLPIETVVRQKVILPDLPAVPADAPMVIDEETGAHWRPALQGAYLLFTDPATPPSPPTENVTPQHRFAFRLLDPASPVSLARVTPFWGQVWENGAAHWMMQAGQYTVTPDHRPLIDQTPIEGLFVNTGYSGHGIMGGPAGSRLLADLLTGKRSLERNPFRLGRAFAHGERPLL